MFTSSRSLMCRVIAGAAISVAGSVSLAQPSGEPGPTTPPPAAPARQPAAQRPPRPDGQPGDGRQDARRAGGGELSSVESAMKLVNRSVRRLKQQIADAEKKEENLKLVGDIERAVVFAKGMPLPDLRAPRGPGRPRPPKDAEQPGGPLRSDPAAEDQPEKGQPKENGERPPAKPDAKPDAKPQAAPTDPKKTEMYRRDLLKLLRQVIELEQDLMDGKLDQAKADLNKLPDLRDEAHKELGVKDEDDNRQR